MKRDFSQRFGFLVSHVSKLYGEQFDKLARERIGLSRAQCRLLSALAMNGEDQPLSQTELAQRLDLSTMAVGGLCDRMAAAGWIRRQASARDRRANEVYLQPQAEKALDAALGIGDALNTRALAVLTPAERAQLVQLLTKARTGLLALSAAQEDAA
jgi:DNA-binding MarR family transcriptional regulator